MNVGVILIAVIMIFAASIGIIAMASRNEAPPVDTMGHTLTAEENQSHDLATDLAVPAAETGVGAGIAVVVLFVCAMLFAVLALILYYKKGNTGSIR